MKGMFTPITHFRRQVYKEIASIAWEDRSPKEVDDIPYKVIDGDIAKYRGSVFHERAIVAARARLGLGLSRDKNSDNQRLSSDVEDAYVTHSIIKEPLINVIEFACEACEDGKHVVTPTCKKCIAHPCIIVCPVDAIKMGKTQTYIDEDKCIDCGKCKDVCPYGAIIKEERPCKAACGADAIESDEFGRAKINYAKCVNCGMCILNCPFAAITDKTDIFQLVLALKRGEKLHGLIAPSFVGQFGPLGTPEKIVEAIKKLGFEEVVEVALGADIAAKHEAEMFRELVPEKQPFLGTSCCPSWTMTVDKFYPELKQFVSSSSTPMVETAKVIKKRNPEGKIVFIGPCVSKKIEAMRDDVREYVDFVITYEELAAIFVATNIDVAEMHGEEEINDASKPGRNFAYASGVTEAVKNSLEQIDNEMDIKTYNANGVAECRKMLALAKAGRLDGYLIEGMGCPGGCVGGAGTLLPTPKAKKEVTKFANESPYKTVYENPNIK
ncbi:MAG TPA: 4Fe-4S dicluster domain-containing protein [Tissierellaceae bacterium]